ncbi:TPA: hypothetical protein QCS32_006304, partial [Bacillus thuringiensis]|nr:hypothetical protein [Bacillus thuringiensis]
KQELTRELYTPIRGTTYRTDQSQNTLSAIENRMTRKPHLFEWLRRLRYEYKWEENPSYWVNGDFITGLGQWIETTLGNNLHKISVGTGSRALDVYSDPNVTDFLNIKTLQWFEPRQMTLIVQNETYEYRLGNITETKPFSPGGPYGPIYSPTERENKIDRHRVSYWMYEPVRSDARPFVIDTWTQLGAITFAWTHLSVDPDNTIAANKITQIPAVKAYYADANIRKGPGNTGGDLVEITKNSSDNTHLQTWV